MAGSLTVHGVHIHHRLLPICCPFNFAQRILQNYDSKTISLLFRDHMGFLTWSIIYMQPGTRPIHSRPIYYNTNTLPEISTSSFFFFFALSRKCETTKQKKLSNSFHISVKSWPATCNLQFTTSDYLLNCHTLRRILLAEVTRT